MLLQGCFKEVPRVVQGCCRLSQKWAWNYPNRSWNFFSLFQGSDHEPSFKIISHFHKGVKTKWIFKIGKGISETGNGCISPTPTLLITNFSYKLFIIYTKDLNFDLQKRKWNYWHERSAFQSQNLFLLTCMLLFFFPFNIKEQGHILAIQPEL